MLFFSLKTLLSTITGFLFKSYKIVSIGIKFTSLYINKGLNTNGLKIVYKLTIEKTTIKVMMVLFKGLPKNLLKILIVFSLKFFMKHNGKMNMIVHIRKIQIVYFNPLPNLKHIKRFTAKFAGNNEKIIFGVNSEK